MLYWLLFRVRNVNMNEPRKWFCRWSCITWTFLEQLEQTHSRTNIGQHSRSRFKNERKTESYYYKLMQINLVFIEPISLYRYPNAWKIIKPSWLLSYQRKKLRNFSVSRTVPLAVNVQNLRKEHQNFTPSHLNNFR